MARAHLLARALLLVVLATITPACRHAELRYALSSVEARPTPKHPRRIAIVPFVDARTVDDGSDDAAGFDYQGHDFEHTRLDDLQGAPLDRVTEVVARHLAQARLFAQVILVRSIDQAPEADLVLSGRLRRLRGYVEAKPPKPESGRPANERMVLAEVLLEDLEVRDAKTGVVVASIDAGGALYEARRHATDRPPPDPWDVLGEVLFHAVSELAAELEAADLSGAVVVPARVALSLAPIEPTTVAPFGALGASPPEGWSATRTSTAARPHGWKATTAGCLSLELEQKQTLRFHRVLGSYHPSAVLWACPTTIGLVIDDHVELPAKYLGTKAGLRYFLHKVGESSWPKAEEELRSYLGVPPPERRYVFELPPLAGHPAE
ncbi:hypothetical protein L6R52_43750 [Myxococcota bacterium]|nr:hypothetical protein [Myxococcota bacterium]